MLFDLGLDITLKNPDGGRWSIPSWTELVRAFGQPIPKRYTPDLVRKSRAAVIGGTPIEGVPEFQDVAEELAEQLVTTLIKYDVDLLVVENGTLPNFPIATQALYSAIAEYGVRQQLGKYVLWRDWDLMWSSEPQEYGVYPFSGVQKPTQSKHIDFAVATEWMKRRMQAWAPGVKYHVIPSRFFAEKQSHQSRRRFRSAYSIPSEAHMIARCTRVIPQKCIERDIRLLALLQQRLDQIPHSRRVYLAVSGPTEEEPGEYRRLSKLQKDLGVSDQVVWIDGLMPFNPHLSGDGSDASRFSVGDLLAESDMSSFLTSYDYEGFGNPPGEAMAASVPFISTTYELYHDVYGCKGAIAPLLPIDRSSNSDDPIPDNFVESVIHLLRDLDHREQVVARNLEVVHRHFSLDALRVQLTRILGWGPE